MTTLDDLQRAARARRDAAQQRESLALNEAQSIGRRADAEGRNLTNAEYQRALALAEQAHRARRELRQLGVQSDELDVARGQEADYLARANESHSTGAQIPQRRASFSVSRNERTYRPDTDPSGTQFVLDVCRNFMRRDPVAAGRLERHMAEERVERPQYLERAAGDTTTGNWSGLVVPQYLIDAFAPQIGALRPFADNCCARVDLPANGMTVNFSKLTTGTSVGIQTTELSAVSATSSDDTLGVASVQTAAGSQNVSRQAIDRGTGIDRAIIQDLYRKYATQLDNTLIQQASTGLTNVAQTVTYTSASPTGPEFWPYMYQAGSKLEAALLGVAFPSHVVMHSRRWNWLASNVASTWPIVGSASVPPQMSAQAQPANGHVAPFSLTTDFGPAVRAILASGLKVVVDNNVLINGSSQDEVYVVADQESIWLAEDPNAPVLITAEQPLAQELGVLLVLYGYFAYFSRYANPASKIVGTGTAAPTGF